MLVKLSHFALAGLAALAACGVMAKDVVIDAQDACLDTGSMTGGRAIFQLPPGSYSVALVENSLGCAGGTPSGACLIDTVIIRGGNDEHRRKTGWGLAIKANHPQKFRITTDATFSAFIVDEPCHDNAGQAILRLESVAP